MPTLDVPFLGHLVLALLLVASVGTFVLALAAEAGRPHALVAARYGTYTTCALTGLAVALLGYAFLTHDFRLTYVARYSDRAMSWYYLITALWGGQDGSILWWTFLLAGYTAVATATLRDRLLPLQPIFLATLMVIFTFFAVLMLYPADPFATQAGSTPADGEGLNPLLQNYWMTIHPPSLYMGFVGWSIPFAFVFSALVTGKVDDAWIKAARPWAMVAWTFLSLGLLLGCLWSYEELGWGGYWAWDPVENASFMPWLAGTAYLHSAIVQERRGILRTWTAFLLCLTFFMTIFGTFLTRSGLIASVHSFAKSDIGMYFGVFLVILAVAILGALAARAKSLATEQRFEGLLSREFAFLFNNWILLSMMVFVLGVTTYPLLNEAFTGEEATLGPPFYNMYMPFLGLLLLFLTGLGPLLAWRRTTAGKLRTALAFPGGLALLVTGLHVAFGARFGYPAYVARPPIADNPVGRVVATMNSALPAIATGLVAFVLAAVLQEFVRGTRARMRVRGESVDVALLTLVSRARRTYGGYVVHAGIALLFFGFTGASYDYEQEATLRPGGTMRIGAYQLEYREPSMRMDPEKRIVETRMAIRRGQTSLGGSAPAKFIYRARPDMPTTEPAITRTLREDLYVTMSAVDPQTRRATFKAQVRPWVDWIWVGGALGLLGSLLAMLPDPRDALKAKRAAPSSARGARVRGLAMAALALGFVLVPTLALGQDSSSAHAGHVHLDNADERTLFPRLLCQCGSCPRLPLDSCVCDWAEQKRQELRVRLEAGETIAQIQRAYAATYGQRAISVPEDRGAGRALWLAPLTVSLAAAGGLFVYGRRRRVGPATAAATSAASAASGPDAATTAATAELDARLDAELERYEEEGE